MRGDLPSLEALGRELEQALERTPPRQRLPRRGARRATVALAAVLVLLVPAAVLGGPSLIFSDDPPDLVEQLREAGTPPELAPQERSATVEATVADPVGGPPWGLLFYRSRTGLTCLQPGRVVDGKVGAILPDGRFRAYPLEHGASCGSPRRDLEVLRTTVSEGRSGTRRTLLFGFVSARVDAVSVGGARPRGIAISRRGAFLAVYPGDAGRLPVTGTLVGGRKITIP